MITIDNFEGIVPYKILMRGEEYYESGAVSDLKETLPGEWTATVDGTSSYTVEISLEGDKVDSWYFQRIKITERKFKKLSKVLVVVKKLVIIIGIMTLNVTGKLFLVNWILCWRKQTSFEVGKPGQYDCYSSSNASFDRREL